MRTRRKHRQMPTINVTATCDVAFLLIIFFIMTSHFIKEAKLHVHPPKDINVKKLETTPIFVTIDPQGQVYFCGKPVKTEEVESLTKAMLEGPNAPKNKLVLFKCDVAIVRKVYEPVIIAISDAGGTIAPMGEAPAKGPPAAAAH